MTVWYCLGSADGPPPTSMYLGFSSLSLSLPWEQDRARASSSDSSLVGVVKISDLGRCIPCAAPVAIKYKSFNQGSCTF